MSGRIRSIKPEWLDDERIAMASPEARVLSISLLLLADDHGNGRANPVMLGGRVFPGAADPRATLTRAMDELASLAFVVLYYVDGQSYFAIRNWNKHQRVDKPGKPHVPGPPESLAKIPESLAKVSGESRESLAPDQRPTTNDHEGSVDPHAPAPAREAKPAPGTDAMFRSLTPTPDRDAQVVALVTETRGTKFRPISHTDRDAVSRLGEWASGMPGGMDDLRRALVAFWTAKGKGASLRWLADEDPGRYLSEPAKPTSRPGTWVSCPPASAFKGDDSELVAWERGLR